MNGVIVSEDYTRAVTLHKRIKSNSLAMEDCFWEVCKGLKEMRDGKLYKELGYQNFEDYSQNEIGMKRNQAYKYAKIADTYTDENVSPGIHLGATKLFLLTKLDEPIREEFIQNNDVSEMSKRELEEKIKEINDLKAEKEEILEHNKQLAEKINSAESDKDAAINEKQALSGVLSTVKADKKRLLEQNEQLLAKVKELEERPIDVTVATPDNSEEIEKLKEQLREEYEDQLCEKHGQLMAEMQRSKENSKIAHEALKEVEDLKKKLEQKPKEIEVPDFEEVFNIYLNTFTDAGRKLLCFVKQHNEYRESAGLWARDIAKDFEI